MSIDRNDNLRIKAPKATRDTDRVGASPLTYASPQDIPAGYRYEFMTTTDDDGIIWRLEGGVADANWTELKLGGGEQEAENITWSELIAKNTNGEVKVWDRYYITDRNDRPLEIVQIDPIGEVWYVITEVTGLQILLKLPKNVRREINVDRLPPLIRARMRNN